MSNFIDVLKQYVSDAMPKTDKTMIKPIASKDSGIVSATDYTALKGASSGVPVNAQWRDGNVSVGGVLVSPKSVVDGKAIVDSKSIDNAIDTIKTATGVKSNQEILDGYGNYKSMYNSQLDKLKEREDFSYDATSDPVYQSYKQEYNREGNRATEDTMGTYNAITGGMPNSHALTAAAQSAEYWNSKLMDVIPTLSQQAYDRYTKQFDMDRQALADILNVSNTMFEREYGVNRDTINDIKDSEKASNDRDMSIMQENNKNTLAQKSANDERDKWQTQLLYNAENDEANRQAQKDTDIWNRAFSVFKATGSVPSVDIANILGIPTDTITSEMKSLFEKLAQQTNQAQIKYQNDLSIQNAKHDNTIQEIYAKKK